MGTVDCFCSQEAPSAFQRGPASIVWLAFGEAASHHMDTISGINWEMASFQLSHSGEPRSGNALAIGGTPNFRHNSRHVGPTPNLSWQAATMAAAKGAARSTAAGLSASQRARMMRRPVTAEPRDIPSIMPWIRLPVPDQSSVPVASSSSLIAWRKSVGKLLLAWKVRVATRIARTVVVFRSSHHLFLEHCLVAAGGTDPCPSTDAGPRQ